MKSIKEIAPHETFDIHELLNIKTISATKCSAMSVLVKDAELKSILQNEFTNCQEHIKELQDLIKLSVLAPQSMEDESNIKH